MPTSNLQAIRLLDLGFFGVFFIEIHIFNDNSADPDLKKPTHLDLHCLLRQGMSYSAREGLKLFHAQLN